MGKLKYVAESVVHELGHILGLGHTESIIKEYQLKLLYDKPRLNSVCGDGIKDFGEQCDCGSRELYQGMCSILTEKTKCCDRKKCIFKNITYQCSSGKCCTGCKFNKGKVCRKAVDECDISDYCSGKSNKCGPDMKAPDYNIAPFIRKIVFVLSSDRPNICNHFICALPFHKKPTNVAAFYYGNKYCIIPLEKHRVGVLSAAARYMPCFWHKNGTKNFCYKGECTSKSNLENCIAGNCLDMNVNEYTKKFRKILIQNSCTNCTIQHPKRSKTILM
ncbi:hypothetical protein MXB_1391 [Myxobolus squamalis]|nr:hypothetical protein MXB_1391 [Myxobolus squamalis]